MQRAVSALAQNRTVLVVAHHLSTIRSADHTRMQQGKSFSGAPTSSFEENAGYYRTLLGAGGQKTVRLGMNAFCACSSRQGDI